MEKGQAFCCAAGVKKGVSSGAVQQNFGKNINKINKLTVRMGFVTGHKDMDPESMGPVVRRTTMISMTLFIALVVGLVTGFIANTYVTKSHGLPTNLIVGLVGGATSPFIASLVGLSVDSLITNVVFTAVVTGLFITLLKLIRKDA